MKAKLRLQYKEVIALFFVLCSGPLASATSSSQAFTYQGRIFNAQGTAPLEDVVDIQYTILDPSKTCILYQETQANIDLTSTSGVFSTQVGSSIGASKRTANDPGLTMASIFSNSKKIRDVGTSNCVNGYTPSAGDSRYLKVVVTPHGTGVPNTLTPDQVINSVPQASSAETLQGFQPTDFVQSAAGVSGQQNVNLANLITLTSGGDASSMHHHDSIYVKIGSGGSSANLGTGAYTSGSFGIGTSNPSTDLAFGGNSDRTIQVDRNGSGDGSSLTVSGGGAQSGSSNQNGGDLVLSGGIATGNGGSNIVFNTSSNGTSGSSDNSPTTKMVLNSSGRLGVGTLNPQAQLEVDSGSASTIGTIIKGFTAQVADLFQVQDHSGAVLAKIANDGSMTLNGALTLPGDPTQALQACTKQYVDQAISSGVSGAVTSFNTRTGAVTLSSSDVTTALGYTPLKNTTDTMSGNLTVNGTAGVGGAPGSNTQFQSTSTNTTQITAVLKAAPSQTADLLQFQDSNSVVLSKVDSTGYLSLAGNPTASLQAATKAYVDSLIAGVQPSGNYLSGLTGDVSATGPGTVSSTVNSVGGSSAANLHAAELAANAATSANAMNTIVKRDASGNFSAGTITATLTGAASLNVLKTGDTMTGPLNLHTATTADALAQILIATGADANKGLVVQGNSAGQSANLTEWQSSAGSVLAKVDASGKVFGKGLDASSQRITNVLDPTAAQDAATKAYVDAQVATSVSGAVTSFNTRTGAITLTSGDVTSALTYTPLKNTTDTLTGNLTVTGTGGFGGAAGANTQLQSSATSATQIGVVIKGAASQSADLFQLQDSSGATLAKFDALGFLTLPGSPTSSLQAATKGYVDSVMNGKVAGSGTTNYIPKFSGSSTLDNSPMAVNGNNIGIGTTSANYKLELSGTASVADQTIGINGTPVVYLPNQGTSSGAIAFGSGLRFSSGAQNTAVGLGALNANTTGYNNTASGFGSLGVNTMGAWNTSNGSMSMGSNSTGSYNVAVGGFSLYTNSTGGSNVAIGNQALYSNTTASNNVAVGSSALYSNTTGTGNTATGTSAMGNNSTGNSNTATGYQALSSNTTGYSNVSNGYQALFSNTSGYSNVASGQSSLYWNTTGYGNVGIGLFSLMQNRGKSESTAIGYYSMGNSDTSSSNTVTNNTAIGAYALYGSGVAGSNTGTANTALGHSALRTLSSGSNNIGIGYNAGSAINTGSNNVVIGSNTGSTIANSSNNILLADGAGNIRMSINSTGAATLNGSLTLPGDPSSANMAATKNYVDTQIAAASGGVSSFNTRTGAVTLNSSDVTTALGYTPLKNSSDTMSGTLGVGGAVGSNTQFRSIASTATNVGAVLQGAASQSADLLQFQNSSGAILSKFDAAGYLTLPGAPTSSLQAATKAYVDSALSSAVSGSGSAGYLPKFSASSTLANSVIFDAGNGSIGIGNSSPSAKLDVSGTVNVKDTLTVGDPTDYYNEIVLKSLYGTGGNGFDVTMFQHPYLGSYTGGIHLSSNSGNSDQYRVSAPSSKLSLLSDGRIAFYTAPSGSVGAAIPFTEAFTILNSGNVGIGTSPSSPSARLDVVGMATTGNKNLSVSSLGQASGPAGAYYGGYFSTGANNNSTELYGLYSEINYFLGSGGRSSYAGYFKNPGSPHNYSAGIYAEASQPDLNGPGSAYGGHFVVKSGSSGTAGSTYGAKIENTATSGASAYGLSISTASGPSTVVPLSVIHNGSEILQVGASSSARLEVNGNIKIKNGSGGGIVFADGTTQTTSAGAPTYKISCASFNMDQGAVCIRLTVATGATDCKSNLNLGSSGWSTCSSAPFAAGTSGSYDLSCTTYNNNGVSCTLMNATTGSTTTKIVSGDPSSNGWNTLTFGNPW